MQKFILKTGAFGLLFLSMFGLAQADFRDVDSQHFYYDAINYVQQNNIVSGYADGTFKPDAKINRAEFVKILIAANYSDSIISDCLGTQAKVFSDVTRDQWFSQYVCVAKKNNIIGGYPDGSFKPAQDISFAEAAKILAVSYQLPTSLDFVWYKPYIDSLADKKAIPGTILSTDYKVTRAEMAEMIYRLKTNLISKFSLTYDEIAGTDKNCVKVGGMANGTVSPQYQTHCCNGEIPFYPGYQKGQTMMGAASVCLEPQTGLQEAVDIYSSNNECTSNTDLAQTTKAPYKNLNFNGFSFMMQSYKAGCAARCDVNLDTKQASIGWMCVMTQLQ
jgi:hypothetical protein